MELVDFKNFEQFLVYSRQHAEEMQHWSAEKHQEFAQKVWKLREENPEFRQKYDNWARRLKAKAEKKQTITIDGTNEEKAYSKAKLKLMRLKNLLNKAKEQNPQEQEKNKKGEKEIPDIVILNKKKRNDRYSI